LARTGRKRKSGRRHPGGTLAQPRNDDRARAALQPHRAWLPADKRLDQRADSALGALNLLGAITDEQHVAGQRYAVIVGEYRAVVQPPRGTAGSGRGHACHPDLCRDDPDLCECRRRKRRYDGCFEALHDAGRKAQLVTGRVAVHGERCAAGEIAALRRGLDALARHLGVGRGGGG
jgi:hypothetical protein